VQTPTDDEQNRALRINDLVISRFHYEYRTQRLNIVYFHTVRCELRASRLTVC